MTQAEEMEAWADKDFEDGYSQFDQDGSGQVEREEFVAFIKRFADL